MRPLIRHWWGRGLKAILHLDDGIVAIKRESAAIQEGTQVKDDLERVGFIVNLDKSKWESCYTMEWLGFQIELAKGEFCVPANKISMLMSQLLEVKGVQLAPARKLASLIGKIVSMSIPSYQANDQGSVCHNTSKGSLVPKFNIITRGCTRISVLD